jgi:hypothetical protein
VRKGSGKRKEMKKPEKNKTGLETGADFAESVVP